MDWSAGKQNRTHHILFDASSADRFSHVFTVTGDASWVIQAYGLAPGQCVCLEMVTGCKDGTDFEPVKASCGCCGLCLSAKRNIIPIPIEGRYRLVACDDTGLGDFKVIAYPTKIPQEFWSSLAMSCCNDAALPVTITSPDGTITVSGSNPNFQVGVSPVPTAGVLAASPVAMNILCSALTASGCIPAAFAETVTTVVPIANGFRYTNEAGTVVDVTFPASVPDIVTTLTPIPGGFIYTNEAGAPTAVMFPASVVDINVSGVSLDAASYQLTVTETDGSTHTVALGGVSAQANNLLSVGPDNKPYLNCAALAGCGFVSSSGVVQVVSLTPGVTVLNGTGPVVGLQVDAMALFCGAAWPDLGVLSCA